jgi:predicted ester cyclase
MTMTNAADVYRAYIDAETRRDDAAMKAVMAPDIRIELNGVAALASADEDIAAMAVLFDAYPDYHRDIIEIIGEGSRASARWRMVGHPRPGLDERLPVIDVRGCSVVVVEDGRMTEAYVWSPASVIDEVVALASAEGDVRFRPAAASDT